MPRSSKCNARAEQRLRLRACAPAPEIVTREDAKTLFEVRAPEIGTPLQDARYEIRRDERRTVLIRTVYYWGGGRWPAKLPRLVENRGGENLGARCAPTRHSVCGASTFCSSPDEYISRTMSQPPMNSPFTYSCGTVGQLAKSLTPWRISGSSSTFTEK